MICLTMGTSCVFKIAECPAGIHPQYTPLLEPWQEQGVFRLRKRGKGRDLRQQKTCRMRRLQALIRQDTYFFGVIASYPHIPHFSVDTIRFMGYRSLVMGTGGILLPLTIRAVGNKLLSTLD